MEVTIKINDKGHVDLDTSDEMTILELLGVLEVAKTVVLTGEKKEEVKEE